MGGTQNWVVWRAGPTAIKHSSSHNSFICFTSTSACYNFSNYAPLRPFLIFICLVSCLQRGWGKEQTSGTHWLTAFLDFHPSISFIEWRLFCEKKQWHRYQRASTRNMQSCFSKCCWLGLLQLYTACFDGRPLEKKVNIKRSFVAACHQTRIINQASRASIGTLQNNFFDPLNHRIHFKHARF